MQGKGKIILALDVKSSYEAEGLVEKLRDEVGAFKIGLELVNRVGFVIFQNLREKGIKKPFYDAKFHDIPNTVAGAMYGAVKRTLPWMINVHCSGGIEMMKAAKEALLQATKELPHDFQAPKIIGVTVLTSINQNVLSEELRIPGVVEQQVVHLAKLAKEAGLDGVVASPHEIEAIREACGPDFIIVTPGVRPAGTDKHDQKRVMTPEEAVKLGANYVVIGRPIMQAEDPVAVARAIAKKIEEASDGTDGK